MDELLLHEFRNPRIWFLRLSVVDSWGGPRIPVMIFGPPMVLAEKLASGSGPFVIRVHCGWRAEVDLDKQGVRSS